MSGPAPDEDPVDPSSPLPGNGTRGTRQLGKQTQEKSAGGSSKSLTEAIVLDAGPDIPIINADEFIADFLPKVPGAEAAVGRIVSWIEECPLYYADRRWAGFPVDPAKAGETEDLVFERLSVVFDAVLAAVSEVIPELVGRRTTEYVAKPTKPPETVFRQDKSRPDAYFLFLNRFSRDKENPHWMDIAVAGEFKKENKPETAESDITQVLWDMYQEMREDQRRRKCFGFTIENRDFRMYSITRSEIVVSRAVDFLSCPSHIIKFFFALMYASEEALGRDMTMTTIWNGDVLVAPQYDIQVQSRKNDSSPVVVRTFRTIELISSIGAEAIRGRGTRVWKVHEVKNGRVDTKKTYVLKDAWVDSDRAREGKVVAEIRKDAMKQLKDKHERDVLLRCLLTTLVEGDVLLTDGTPDCTLSGRKRGRHIVKNTDRFSLTPYTAPSKLKPTALPLGASPKRKRKRVRGGAVKSPGDHKDVTDGSKGLQESIVYDAKTHYRIVFKEVCDVLHELSSLFDIVYTLWKVCNALEVLHKLGWVHRDISSGNIMICGNDAKITDFEYAKKMTLPGTVHEIRTGTEDFMAIEVRAQEFSFMHEAEDEDEAQDDDIDMLNLPRNVHAKAPRHPKKKRDKVSSSYTWFYNPLHDMESVFWLLLYFIANKDVFLGNPIPREMPYIFSPETEDQQHRRVLGHWNFGLTLFSGRGGRDRVMLIAAPLANHLDSHPLHPAIDPLADVILKLRAALAKNYRRIERRPSSIDHTSGAEVHEVFKACMKSAVCHLLTVPWDVRVRSLRGAVEALPKSFSTTHASIGSKRGREDGDAGRQPKSQRVSLDQKSPSRSVSPDASPRDEAPAAAATEAKRSVPLPPTRVLRSHSRKVAAEKTSPPSPRLAARARKVVASKTRKGKATKNDEAAKAAAKVAATKVKSKTRKGR